MKILKTIAVIVISVLVCSYVYAVTIGDITYTIQDDGIEAKNDQPFIQTTTATKPSRSVNECRQRQQTLQDALDEVTAECDGKASDADKLNAR